MFNFYISMLRILFISSISVIINCWCIIKSVYKKRVTKSAEILARIVRLPFPSSPSFLSVESVAGESVPSVTGASVPSGPSVSTGESVLTGESVSTGVSVSTGPSVGVSVTMGASVGISVCAQHGTEY